MSALAHFADSSRISHEVREVPIADSCGAANSALFDDRVGTGELPCRCKAVSGGFRRQRQRSLEHLVEMEHLNSALARRGGRVVGTDRRSLSFVHQIPSNGEDYEKDSDDDPNFDARHNEMTPRCKRNSPTGVHEFCWRRVSSLGQGAGVSIYPARSMLRSKKKPRPAGGRGLD
jgi:hypothetical protein